MSAEEKRFTSMPKGAVDSAFLNHEVEDHRQTIADVKAMRQHASNAQLQQAIDQALPILQGHLEKAQQLQQSLASNSSSSVVPTSSDTRASGKAGKKTP